MFRGGTEGRCERNFLLFSFPGGLWGRLARAWALRPRAFVRADRAASPAAPSRLACRTAYGGRQLRGRAQSGRAAATAGSAGCGGYAGVGGRGGGFRAVISEKARMNASALDAVCGEVPRDSHPRLSSEKPRRARAGEGGANRREHAPRAAGASRPRSASPPRPRRAGPPPPPAGAPGRGTTLSLRRAAGGCGSGVSARRGSRRGAGRCARGRAARGHLSGRPHTTAPPAAASAAAPLAPGPEAQGVLP